MARLGLIAILVCALCSAATAADQIASDEALLVQPYPSDPPWKVLQDKRSDKLVWIEWIPADQTERDIKDILTEQIFFDLKNADPSAFVLDLFKRIGRACNRVRINGPKAGTENDYPVAYGQAYCVGDRSSGKDVDIFIKAIGGHDAMYVVQVEFRRPATPGATPGITTFGPDQLKAMVEKMTAQSTANNFLVEKVQLCATGIAGTACAGQPNAPAPVK